MSPRLFNKSGQIWLKFRGKFTLRFGKMRFRWKKTCGRKERLSAGKLSKTVKKTAGLESQIWFPAKKNYFPWCPHVSLTKVGRFDSSFGESLLSNLVRWGFAGKTVGLESQIWFPAKKNYFLWCPHVVLRKMGSFDWTFGGKLLSDLVRWGFAGKNLVAENKHFL